MALGECIHETVGRGITSKAQAAQHGRQRREQHAEIQRLIGQGFFEGIEGQCLWAEVHLALFGAQLLQRGKAAGVRDTGGVYHAVEGSEAGVRLL